MKKPVLAALLITSMGCGTDESSVPDRVDDTPIVEAAQRVAPTLTLTEPQRGIFVLDSTVRVAGRVDIGSSDIAKVEVNKQAADYDPSGAWSYTHTIEPGPNILGIRAEGTDGGRAVDAVSVFGGDVHAPGTTLENAVQIHLGTQFLDDNEPDLDDISGIVQQIISDETFLESLTSEPFQVGDETITVDRIQVDSANVDLTPDTNCVDATMSIIGTEIDLTTTGIAAILGDQVFVTADDATVDLRICGTSTPGEFDVVSADVEFDNLVLATNENPDLATDLPSVHSTLVNLLESAMGAWLGDSLGGFLTDLLSIFQLDYTIAGITLSYQIAELSAHPAGLEVILRGSADSTFGLPEMWAGAGSLKTDDAPLGDDFSDAPIALALSDDALNQLLFAYWWSGSIADFEVDPAALSELPEIFQPLSNFEIALGLPPTVLPATYPEEYAFDLASGEVGLLIQTDTKTFDTGLHVRAGANVSIDENGGIGMQLDGRAQKITVHAHVASAPDGVDKGNIAALLRLIVPTVLKSVDVNYGGFPLPDFELSAFSENVEGFQGKSIGFRPTGSGHAGEGGGYLVVEGQLEEK